MAKILIVDDDPSISELVSLYLTEGGHLVQTVSSGRASLDLLRDRTYDLIILDWLIPEMTGLEVCRRYRANGGKLPILMLTARASTEDKAVALDTGADDYLTKPFDFRELAARVRALLRRPPLLTVRRLQTGDISLDLVTCTVTRSGIEIHLRPRVYRLLEFLMRHTNQVFSAQALRQRVWTDDSLASNDTVRAHIKLLRQSVDTAGATSLISTVKGYGYMLKS